MVLVTGGSGLVGSHLMMELLREGRKVKALCRPESDLHNVRDLFAWYGLDKDNSFEEIRWVEACLNDLPSLEAAFEGVTEVYHCAALISFDPRDEDRLLKANMEGTRNIVNLCLDKGVSRLNYISSTSTIGGTKGTLTEKDHWDPSHTHVYGTSKYLAEMEVWRGGQEGLQTIIINPGVILGPGFWKAGSGTLFSRVYSGLTMAPPGATGFIGVWDVVRALKELREVNAFNERFVMVAENLEYKEVLQRIAKLLDVPVPATQLKGWHLEILWRMDWLRAHLFGRSRRLSKAVARSLQNPVGYSSEKLIQRTGFVFQPLDQVLKVCADQFRDTVVGPQS